jgi:hypothetical protein
MSVGEQKRPDGRYLIAPLFIKVDNHGHIKTRRNFNPLIGEENDCWFNDWSRWKNRESDMYPGRARPK